MDDLFERAENYKGFHYYVRCNGKCLIVSEDGNLSFDNENELKNYVDNCYDILY